MKRFTFCALVLTLTVCHFPVLAQQTPNHTQCVRVVNDYVTAALNGRIAEAAALASPDDVTSDKETIEQLGKMLNVDSIPLSECLCSDRGKTALVISDLVTLTDTDRDKERVARLAFTVQMIDGKWLVEDIDIESEEGVKSEIERFGERFPDAKKEAVERHPTVTSQSRRACPLEFRILPNAPDEGRQPVITQAVCDSMKKALPVIGKALTEFDGNRFRWCEVDASVGDLPFTAEYEGRTFAVVSADPSRMLQWNPSWAFREIESSASRDNPRIRTLGIELDNLGAASMRELTKSNLHNRLAIIVGGKIVSAPTIRGELGNRAQITGSFSDEEWDRLTSFLFNAADIAPDTASSDHPAVDGDPAERFDQIKVFSLVNVDAAGAKTLLMQLYGDDEVRMTAGANPKSLVVRGGSGTLAEIEALLLRLDTEDARERAAKPEATVAATEETVAQLRQDYSRHEQDATQLAATIRELKLSPSPDAKEIDRRLADLRAIVQSAFEARQALQDEELKRLRQRLQRIEAQIIGRDQAKQRIIDRRVEDLVGPNAGTRRN